MSITTQYMDATRKVQDNWFTAFDALTNQYMRQLERPVAVPMTQVDLAATVDEFFDVASRALAVQRETTHKVLSANAEFAEQWRNQAQQLQGSIREQAQVATDVARDRLETFSNVTREQVANAGETVERQVESTRAMAEEQVERATDVAAEQTKRNYNLMNSAQLKAELAARNLAQFGSLDEMRKRLKDADKA